MHFIRIIQAATKNNTRTKKLTKKPSKKLPKTTRKLRTLSRRPSKIIKTAPKNNLNKKDNKNIRPSKTKVKTNKDVSRRFKIRPNTGYPLQDVSLPVFEDLLDQGYNMITLVAWSGACAYCKKKNGKTMPLARWLNQLQHEAPVFEAFHVNSQSELKVWDKNGELPDVFVNYEGDIHE